MSKWEQFIKEETKAKGLKLYDVADALQYNRKYFYRAIKREPSPRFKTAVENFLKGAKDDK